MRRAIILACLGLQAAVFGSNTLGSVTFFGPQPYLSIADSPFDTSGAGFFIEDFEDGTLDTPPGVREWYPGIILEPSAMTDSVDADDGSIDGQSTEGYSFYPTLRGGTFSNPPLRYTTYGIVFEETSAMGLPNFAGVAVTDGVPDSTLLVSVREANGNYQTRQFRISMDGGADGETAEDLFVGATSDQGIRTIKVEHQYVSHAFDPRFEVDHVQFGYYVPEPNCSLVIVGVLLIHHFQKFRYAAVWDRT